jgi:hypothetical protein
LGRVERGGGEREKGREREKEKENLSMWVRVGVLVCVPASAWTEREKRFWEAGERNKSKSQILHFIASQLFSSRPDGQVVPRTGANRARISARAAASAAWGGALAAKADATATRTCARVDRPMRWVATPGVSRASRSANAGASKPAAVTAATAAAAAALRAGGAGCQGGGPCGVSKPMDRGDAEMMPSPLPAK